MSERAILECQIAIDGDCICNAIEETPAGMGFGQAAMVLAQDWRFEPQMQNGQARLSVARFPIEFQNRPPSPPSSRLSLSMA